MNGLIDSHFHVLQMRAKGVDITDLLEQLDESGWIGGIDIGVDADDLAERSALLSPYPNIKLAAGIGPWGAQGEEPVEAIIGRFADHIQGLPCAFIGEIGLDQYWKYGTPCRQRDLFEQQIDLASTLGLPVIIHSRDADEEMQDVLRSRRFDHSGIMHCFSSGRLLLDQALASGLNISFAGPITYKNNNHLRELLASVPIDRLLLETDSPYLSPEPRRGRVNTPMHMPFIYQAAARVHSLEVEKLAKIVRRNFERLCALSDTS